MEETSSSAIKERFQNDPKELNKTDTGDISTTLEKQEEEVIIEHEETSNTEFETKKTNDEAERNSESEDNLEIDPPEKTTEETKIPLMQDDLANIDLKLEGEDTPTLPMHKKQKEEGKQKKKPPIYLFPITRLRLAWTSSSSVPDFVLKAILIIFSTLGWMFCVGGFPFVSIAMFIIGSIYIDDCDAQPNIPIYLIVSGVFGTAQHIISLWTKYLPKESQGKLKIYRSYCRVIDGVITLFLSIWFVLGCIWVYGVKEVEFRDRYKIEYCHKTLYYFAFWLMNFSFMILCLLVVLSLCCILCLVSTPKDEEKGVIQ